jgi:signal transduction histidine kinase
VNAPQDHDKALLNAGGAPAAIIQHKDWVLEQFCDRVRSQLPAAARESRPMIVDTLPAFITRVAMAVAPGSTLEFASEYSNIAMQHGNERAKLTEYSLAEVIHEYQIVRELLVEALRDDGAISPEQWSTIHRSIDEAMAQGAAAFVEVQQRFRSLFTAALSHDFRGPLQNAINYLELIRRDAEPAQRAHFAERAATNLGRIDQMIGVLLDVTRSNAGARLPLHVAACEAGEVVRDIVTDMARRDGDRFVLDIECPVHGHWDCARLRQAVENLLTNAVKYGRSGTKITTRVCESHGRLFVSVHNVGEPIAPEEIPQLFRAFQRSASAERSSQTGWGLGLVLVQAIAEAHGGSVGVESRASTGTTFTLDILCDVRAWQQGS